MYVCNLDYLNVPQITINVNDQGEETEEKKDPEIIFLQKLLTSLQHTGNLLSKYHQFRQKVPLMPLMPDKYAIKLIEDLKADSEEYQQWLAENEGGLNAAGGLN